MSISYDGAGNPISYPRLSDNVSYYMQWNQGRQLAYLDYATNANNETQIHFAYDADGIRTQKNVNGIIHNYITQNGKVVRETVGTGSTAKVLDFIYDASGRPFALKYTNGTAEAELYYYILNLQGDVVALMTESRSIVAKYSYNAWGELLSVTNANNVVITDASHIAHINPLRYRGYYYDSETGFYYLQSRYYDPTMHRFINADSYQSTGQGMLGHNMFAYCRNNPVHRIDDSGYGDKEDADGDGDCYEINQYGGGGNGAYAGHNYGGHVSAPTSSYASSGYNASGYYSPSVSYTTTTSTSYSTSSTYTGSYGYGSYGYGSYGYGGENRYTGDQQALLRLAKDYRHNMTMENAKTLVQWGEEYGFENCRIDMGHENGKNAVTQGPHLHLGPYDHIQILTLN